jgi:pyruvate dehydrogenase E2 component (dihydrolipoamide acetyltransferase)
MAIEIYVEGVKKLGSETETDEYKDKPLSSVRKTIARRLVESKAPVPHFYVTTEIDMERLVCFRKSLKAFKKENHVSFNDIVVKAAALTLKKFPPLNASFRKDRIRYYKIVHIGIAVAIDDGLITPVLRNADEKSLYEIAEETTELVERARQKKLRPDEYTGATFTISNMAMYDVDNFAAIINPPESAILAVGSVVRKPVAMNDRVEIRDRMKVTVSCDHRVIDGATAAGFLQALRKNLEKPIGIVL